MIFESWPWKQEIKRKAKALENRMRQRRWVEASFANTEQDVMLSAYAVRKLFEAKKISDEIRLMKIPITAHKATGKPVTHYNWHLTEELYDLEKNSARKVAPLYLMNQVIHSYVFILSFEEDNGLAGFLVASNWQRSKRLYYVQLTDFIKYLRLVAEDNIVFMKSKWNESLRDYDIVSSSKGKRE